MIRPIDSDPNRTKTARSRRILALPLPAAGARGVESTVVVDEDGHHVIRQSRNLAWVSDVPGWRPIPILTRVIAEVGQAAHP
jgi:hypothetical protein